MKKENVLPRVVIYTTGGTIQCAKDELSGKVAPALTGIQTLERLSALKEHFSMEIIELFNMPGSDLTLENGLELSRSLRLTQQRDDIDGIVVLQGTDTMDEIPFFINVTVRCRIPVVFTGSMKSSHDLYSDALGNVFGAATTACDPQSVGRGVLVYFNETIFSADDVNKYHSCRIDAFRSPLGPLGTIVEDRVRYYRSNIQKEVYPVENVHFRVPILKCYTGIEPDLFTYIVNSGIDGIVIEGYGTGNIPFYLSEPVRQAAAKGIYVIVTTRCVDGESYACYDYVGGGAQLERFGVMLSGELNAIKSRILLIALLSAGKSDSEIRKAFSEGS
ncbi:MAG: asparaginase [Eubacterium sp.]|nr:asparaginase [Eubacterium sp.]